MKGLTALVISMSTNLNVKAYNDILGIKFYSNSLDRTLFYSNMTVSLCIRQGSKTHPQTPEISTYGYSPFIHFKTVATEVEIQFLSTLISLLAQFGSAFFSSKERVPILLST